ncbi:MAG: hypothetical protein P4L62_04595 [Candidatus Pacebacteria bacterium]|nr:hypothetical protein [Candidatus Paceibacterota bacterium]MDR3583610.1 hypothetical protein [Candidatus Paceibacterota bacterium]
MIKVEGHEFVRAGAKIGRINGEYIYDHSGKKAGYFFGNQVYNSFGRKVAYLEGDYIHFHDSSQKIRIEDNNWDVSGGSLNNVQRAAVRVLLGE